LNFRFNTQAPGERQRLLAAFERFVTDHQLPAPVAQAADLALEEHLTNLLTHGHQAAAEHEIEIRLSIEAGELKLEVSDDATPFDPRSHPPPDLTLPLEERPIGGLGIHMILKLMTRVAYARVDGRNTFTMWRKLT
jgi:anti-sigma regulatory factor (Ser/Thr protein kinase)